MSNFAMGFLSVIVGGAFIIFATTTGSSTAEVMAYVTGALGVIAGMMLMMVSDDKKATSEN